MPLERAGAAAGSYIGCNQQRARAAAEANANTYRAGTTLRIRSGPGTGFRQSGSLAAGQPFTAVARQGDWIQIATTTSQTRVSGMNTFQPRRMIWS